MHSYFGIVVPDFFSNYNSVSTYMNIFKFQVSLDHYTGLQIKKCWYFCQRYGNIKRNYKNIRVFQSLTKQIEMIFNKVCLNCRLSMKLEWMHLTNKWRHSARTCWNQDRLFPDMAMLFYEKPIPDIHARENLPLSICLMTKCSILYHRFVNCSINLFEMRDLPCYLSHFQVVINFPIDYSYTPSYHQSYKELER